MGDKIYFPRRSEKRFGRVCALGDAAGSGGNDPRGSDDLCGHVLLRGRGGGRDQSGGEAAMLAYTEKFLKRWQGDALIHAAVAPHSIYTCSEKTLHDAAELARKYRAPILIHVAEMKKELDDSREKNGTTPVQYLDKIGVLGADLVAAHCIYVDETDRKILAEKKTGCVHNPSSNMMLASGVAPVAEVRAAGGYGGLG